MLEMRKMAPARLGRVLVLGYGVSGKAALDYLKPLVGTRVESIAVFDAEVAEAEVAPASVIRDEAALANGGYAFDVCIASPGISQFSDLYKAAEAVSAEVISEVEFAWRESAKDSYWAAITGTNGKTTTTALTAHICESCGMRAQAVGNIGSACITAVAESLQQEDGGQSDVFIAETSSYQLASIKNFAPNVAIVLNITPDHLSWHKSHENYANAKWNVLSNLKNTPGAVAVLDATNDEVRAKVRELRQMSDEERGFAYVPIGTADGVKGDMRKRCGSKNAAFETPKNNMCIALNGCEHHLGAIFGLQIQGSHNVGNALAAATCAIALGASTEKVATALCTFPPLEHRLETAGFVNGVKFINDSKATNVDAVLKALVAYGGPNTIILLGGRDKGTDLQPLVEACESANLKMVVNYGESRERFAEAFANSKLQTEVADNLESALDKALSHARQKDVVLLSPACASFDEFSCFEERGDKFKEMVAARSKATAFGDRE